MKEYWAKRKAEEANKRLKNARDALEVFAKIRESLNDGGVYVNMGHCYYARDDFDRAIESVGPIACYVL